MGKRGWLVLSVVLLTTWLVGFSPAGAAADAADVNPDFTQIGTLVDPGADEELGSTAVSGDTVFAGAPDATVTQAGQGVIFAYTEPSGGWTGTPAPSATLQASDPETGDGLGTVLAIDGSSVVTGDSQPSGSGEVRVFDEPSGGWSGTITQSATLVTANGALLYAPTASGSTIVALGATLGADGIAGQQLLYVFTEPAGGWSGTVLPSAILVPPNGRSITDSGSSVAIGDGEIIAGSTGQSAVYVFEEPNGGWTGAISPAATLTVPSVTELGWSVTLVGSTVVAGQSLYGTSGLAAGQNAYAFTEPAGGWVSEEPNAVLQDAGATLFPDASSFGQGALVSSGSTLLIPAAGNPSSGSTQRFYAVYDMPTGGWAGGDVEPNASLIAGDLETASFDGSDVMAGSGTMLANGGGPGAGPAVTGGAFSADVTSGPTSSGDTVANLGDVAVFTDVEEDSGTVTPAAALVAPADPNTVPDDGAAGVAIFSEPAAGWTNVSSPSAEGAVTGSSVPVSVSSFSVSGSEVAASWDEAGGDTSGSSAYVYVRPSSGWIADNDPGAMLSDPHGWPLSDLRLSGDEAVAVATDPTASGSSSQQEVDVFQEPSAGWIGTVAPAAEVVFSRGGVNAAAISGTAMVISSRLASGDDADTAYVATRGSWSGPIAADPLLTGTNQKDGVTGYDLPLGFSGGDIVLGGVTGGNLLATTVGAEIFARSRDGLSFASRPVATLTVTPVSGRFVRDWLFREPATGWRGSLKPVAHLRSGTITSISADAGQVAVQLGQGSDEGCSFQDYLLRRPSTGWTGTLRGVAAETPLAGAGPCGGAYLSAGVLEGDDLIASQQLGDQSASLSVYAMAQVPADVKVTPGAPQADDGLVGATVGHPALNVEVTAGVNEASLTSITITAPEGLSFVRASATLKRAVRVCREAGVTCTAPRPNQLRLAINPEFNDQTSESVIAGPRVLRESTALRRSVQQTSRTLRFTVRIVDASGAAITRTAVIRAR